MRWLAGLLIALPGVLFAAPDRALLVGVSAYHESLAAVAPPLVGPANDVLLIRDTLAQLGMPPDRITLMSDKAGDVPTRDTVLGALAALTETATRGEEIVIFLAGHGAQVPARGAGETDGLDEVFLPADARLEGDTYVNLIRDDDFGDFIDAMVARGAHVWLIADICHAGSIRRSDGTGLVPRRATLSGSRATSPGGQIVDHSVPSGAGSFVGFFAAQPGALAFEMREPDTGAAHGLFSWALAAALTEGKGQSYGDLAREVTARLWASGYGEADPAFSGALERGLSWSARGATAASLSFEADGFRFDRGRLAGFVPGSTVRISTGDGPLLETEITEAGLTEAFASLPSATPRLDALIAAEGLSAERFRDRWLADRAATLKAEVIATPVDFTVSIGLAAGLKASAPELETLLAALGPGLSRDDESPDLWLQSEGEGYAIYPASASARKAMMTDLAGLPDLLRRAAKARGLMQLPDMLAAGRLSGALEAGLTVNTRVRNEDGGCGDVLGASTSTPLDRPPTVTHCDAVTLDVRNTSDETLNLTPLYLSPDFQVFFLSGYEGSEAGGWRIGPGETSRVSYTEVTRSADGTALATGPMHLLLLAVPAPPDGPPVDFRYLEQRAPPPLSRASPPHPMAGLFDAAGFGLAFTRSLGHDQPVEGAALLIALETVQNAP
ncbi:MAG: caspase family protein [Pseudomonadota bacterium]